ncbi:MAG: TolC family protein [Leptospiraceae bacterium]|nr:TolC family protein [Leptospiraceae bacterium]
MEDLEKYAVKNNPLYLAEKRNIGMARGDLITATLWRNPVIAYQQQFMKLSGTNTGNIFANLMSIDPSSGGPPEYAPSFTWDIDVNGIYSQRTKVASQALKAHISEFSDFDRLFRLRIRQYYWLYLYILELVSFQKEFYENYNELLEMNKYRMERGDIAPLEYERLELEKLRIEKEYKDTEILRAQAEKELLFLMGVFQTSNKKLAFKDKLKFHNTQELSLNVKDYSIDDRPDLASLKYQALQNQLAIDLQKKENGFLNFLTIGGETRRKGQEQYAGVFASMPLKIFDRGQGEILKAQEKHKKSLLQIEAKKRQILTEIQAAIKELKSREELLQYYRKINLYEKNKNVQEKYRLAYIRGASNLVSFLEAEKNYLNFLKSYYEQIYLYYNSIEVFRAAIGKLGSNN